MLNRGTKREMSLLLWNVVANNQKSSVVKSLILGYDNRSYYSEVYR
jgi:hypothetical protein